MESVLSNVFFRDKLEELLIANWTHFLDSSKLLAYVLYKIQENTNNLTKVNCDSIIPKGIKITLSRFYFESKGLFFWVEFSVPLSKDTIAEGTIELCLDHPLEDEIGNSSLNKNISYISMTGNVYCLKK